MKVSSIHFVLKGKSDYKSLAPVFPDILKMFLAEIGQKPEEEEILQMLIDLNVSDLELNRKPEGYNRKGKVRLVFPMDSKEFYLKTYGKADDLKTIADKISEMLTAAKIKFEIKDKKKDIDDISKRYKLNSNEVYSLMEDVLYDSNGFSALEMDLEKEIERIMSSKSDLDSNNSQLEKVMDELEQYYLRYVGL